VQLELQGSGAELMQLAHVRSGPVQLVGWPSQVTIGHAHEVFHALSHAAVSSSSLPQADSTKPNKQTTNDTDPSVDFRIRGAK
jgi:hypothetical protein